MERIRIKHKESNFLYNLVVIILIGGILFFSYRLLINGPLKVEEDDYYKDFANDEILNVEKDSPREMDFFSEVWTRIKGMRFTDPTYILSAHLPYLNIANADEKVASSSDEKIDDDIATIADQGVGLSGRGDRPLEDELNLHWEIDEREDHVSEEIRIEIKNIEDSLPPVTIEGEGPQILIYHTHSREAYKQDPNNPYKPVINCRSMDPRVTVMGVGEELARQLQNRGIPVLHDRTDHEKHPWKSGLYPKSLETIQQRTKEHDTLKIFLDVHRDYPPKIKDPDKEVVIIDGERVAKFFVLIGTGKGVQGGFDQKPKYKENYQFALRLTNKVNEKYPGLAGDIKIQNGRYNQHISNRAILLEVGNQLTTFAEAKRSAKYIAEALSEIIEK